MIAIATEVAIHEMGHAFDWHVRPSGSKWGWSATSSEWLKAGGWVNVLKLWVTTKGDEAVTDYATANPGEDFAETFTWTVNGTLKDSLRDPSLERQNALTTAIAQLP